LTESLMVARAALQERPVTNPHNAQQRSAPKNGR
jgi:hypothetical protein